MIKRLFFFGAVLGSTPIYASTFASALDNISDNSFENIKQLSQKASFIYGRDLAMQYAPSAYSSVRRHEGHRKLVAISVTPKGKQFYSELDTSSFTSQKNQKNNNNERMVIDEDDRVRVDNTTSKEYRNFGRLSSGCTGTLIGSKYVLTAGHCVADGNGNWYGNIKFVPAQNGYHAPYGRIDYETIYTTSEFFNYNNSSYDYAVIVLKKTVLPMDYIPPAIFSPSVYSITGYPGEHNQTMWTSSGLVKSDPDNEKRIECFYFSC